MEYQGNKEEIYKMKYIAFEIYILAIRFHKNFLSVNTNSGKSSQIFSYTQIAAR
jgi:hypothetical protein